MTSTGVKQGRTIVLDDDLKLDDGEKVLVEVERIVSESKGVNGGLLRLAGALADDPDFERVMEEIARDRKNASHRELPN